MMLFLFITLFATWAAAEESATLPRLYVTETPWSDEFSDRVIHAPFQKVTPNSLQLTSPQFENLFSNVTSVQSRSNGSPTTSLRGSSQAARVLFLLDNIPLNFLDGFGGSSLFVPSEILDHINVFEGPASANYGSNAMGGALHFVPTHRETSLLRIGLSDTDSSALQPDKGTLSNANIAVITPLIHTEKHKVQVSAFLEKDRGDFPYTNAQGKKFQRADNSQQTQRFTLRGRHLFDDWQISHLLIFTDLNKTTPGPIVSPLKTQQDSKALLAGFSSEHKLSTSTLWISRWSYAALHSKFYDFTMSKTNSDKIWLNQSLSWEFSKGYLSRTTIDWSKNFYDATFSQNQTLNRIEPEVAQSFILPIKAQLLLEPTVRYLARYKKTLLQLNLPYEFDSGKMWLMYSEGFRSPSLSDLYDKTSYFVGNPNLRPEESKQYEVGYSWHMDGITTTASLFSIDYQNLLQGTVLPAGAFSKTNVGHARTLGINGKIEVQKNSWQWLVSHSYMQARELPSNTPLRFSPEHQFFASLSYPLKKISLTAQQTYWSRIFDLAYINNKSESVSLGDWVSTDLLMTFKGGKALNVQFGMYNIFNHRREMTFGYPEPQRRVALAMEYAF